MKNHSERIELEFVQSLDKRVNKLNQLIHNLIIKLHSFQAYKICKKQSQFKVCLTGIKFSNLFLLINLCKTQLTGIK